MYFVIIYCKLNISNIASYLLIHITPNSSRIITKTLSNIVNKFQEYYYSGKCIVKY